MTTLHQWLKESTVTVHELADRSKVNALTIKRSLFGHSIRSDTRERIEAITGELEWPVGLGARIAAMEIGELAEFIEDFRSNYPYEYRVLRAMMS